jgi:integrase
MRSALENHILPRFRTSRLTSIKPQAVEAWMFDLLDQGLSPKRINNIAGCLRVMLGEAKRLGLLQANPFDQVRMFAGRDRDRGTFSIEEIRILFGPDSLEKIWNGHQLHRAVNELAAATGLRQGEILALQDEDIHEDHIHISHSYHWKYGLLPTKTRQERDVPVPARVLEDIAFFLGSGGYVFSMNRGETPATGSRVTQALYDALERAGITVEERKRRNLTFHSWRHTFNSLARSHAVPTAILQRVTGHSTLQMTDHYTQFQLADFRDVAALQSEVFK